jgi:hypothetical protein
VIDQPAWEAQYGMRADGLQRGELAAAAPTASVPVGNVPRVTPSLNMLAPTSDIGAGLQEIASGANEDPPNAFLGAKNATDQVYESVTLYDEPQQAIMKVEQTVNVTLANVSDRWDAVPYSGPVAGRLLVRRDRPGSAEGVLYVVYGPYVLEIRAVSLAGTDPALVQDPISRMATGIVARMPR